MKLAPSFVRDVITDANGATIAKTIGALAQGMSLAVIAEGVETRGQRDLLARQGYLFGRLGPVEVPRMTSSPEKLLQ